MLMPAPCCVTPVLNGLPCPRSHGCPESRVFRTRSPVASRSLIDSLAGVSQEFGESRARTPIDKVSLVSTPLVCQSSLDFSRLATNDPSSPRLEPLSAATLSGPAQAQFWRQRRQGSWDQFPAKPEGVGSWEFSPLFETSRCPYLDILTVLDNAIRLCVGICQEPAKRNIGELTFNHRKNYSYCHPRALYLSEPPS